MRTATAADSHSSAFGENYQRVRRYRQELRLVRSDP
jgi:hypothetical protein